VNGGEIESWDGRERARTWSAPHGDHERNSLSPSSERCWCSLGLHLFFPLTHSSRTTEVGEERQHSIFPAGARTPPWAHQRPTLFSFSWAHARTVPTFSVRDPLAQDAHQHAHDPLGRAARTTRSNAKDGQQLTNFLTAN
jgi:hypothetical protein